MDLVAPGGRRAAHRSPAVCVPALACGLLLLYATWLAYAPHLRTAEAIYEDPVWQTMGHADWWPVPSGRPLTIYSWKLLGADDIHRQHVANVALHTTTGVVVGWWLADLLGSVEAGIWGMGIFLLWPFAVPAVAYGGGRGYLLSTPAIVGACLACRRGRGHAWRWPVVIALSVVAYLAKETAISLVGLLPLMCPERAACPPRAAADRDEHTATGIWTVVLVLLSAAIIHGAPVVWRLNHDPATAGGMGWGRYLHGQADATRLLLQQMLWPRGLTVDPAITLDRWTPLVALGGASLVLLARWLRGTLTHVERGLLWILLCLAPRWLVKQPGQWLAPHQAYTAWVGGVLVALAGLRACWERLTQWLTCLLDWLLHHLITRRLHATTEAGVNGMSSGDSW